MFQLQIKIILCLTLLPGLTLAQLPRRAFLGVQMATATDNAAQQTQATGGKGVVVLNTIPASTARQLDLRPNDIILRINETETNAYTDVVGLVRQMKAGDPLRFTLIRDGKTIRKEGNLQPYPQEVTTDIETVYGEMVCEDATLRTILTKPRQTGKRPAVLWVGGISCYSVDSPLDTTGAEVQICRYLSRNGYVTMRYDRPGLGDSQGKTPCSQCDFQQEAQHIVNVVRQLKKRDDVDASQVFLLGHSMGGVLGPLAAKDETVKGIIVYGAIGKPFLEYLIDSRRLQAETLNRLDMSRVDEYMKVVTEFCTRYLVLHQPANEILANKPDYAYLADLFADRVPAYYYQLHDLNIARLWKEFGGHALLLWGTHDYISHPGEHLTIKKTMDLEHPGKATVKEIENANHSFSYHPTFEEARLQQIGGPLHPQVGSVLVQWLQMVEKS